MRIALVVALAALPLAAGSDNTFVLRNATVHPVTGPDIGLASVLVEDGKIVDVGTKVAAPKGVKVIDLKGLHVYPGMIDSATELGLNEISSIRETDDTGELGTFNPQLRTSIAVNPASEQIPATRVNGITSAIVFPGLSSGRGFAALLGGQEPKFILGQTSLMSLDGWTWEEMELKRTAGMVLSLPATPPDNTRIAAMLGLPQTQMTFAERRRRQEQQLRQISQFLEQARAYAKAKAVGAPGLKADLKLEAMIPVVDGKVPVIVQAVREKDIREAVKFADQEKLKLVLAGVREPGKMAEDLAKKKIPVILGPTLALPMDDDDRYDQESVLPGELFRAGVKVAFGSFGNQFARNLPYQAANAVAFGLPYAEALKAVTINAAEIWGVADEVGSIERGKVANLVVTDGDPLEAKTQVKHLFIRGEAVSLETKHTRLYEKYLNRP